MGIPTQLWRRSPALGAFLGLAAVVIVVIVVTFTWPDKHPHHDANQGMHGDEGKVQVMRAMFKATEDTAEDDLVPFTCSQSNAFEQLMQLWKISTEPNSLYAQRRGPLEDIRWRRYHVHTHRNNSRGLLMTIQEYHPDPSTPISTMAAFDPLGQPKKPSDTKLVPTTGGSNFHVQWDVFPAGSYEDEDLYDWMEPDQWLSKSACTITDHFTGQYTICCRPPAHAAYGISKLTILADYINYEPYQSAKRGKPRQLPILSTRWMGKEASKALDQTSDLEGPLPSPLRGWPACPGGMSQLSLQGEWMAMGGAYRWVDPIRQCVTPVISKDEVLACYTTDIDSLTMMGDSHLRQMANWFYGYFGVYQIKQGEIDSAYVPKVRFLWTTTGMNLAQRLQYSFYNTTLFMGRPLTKKDILVLDTAHWDLWETEVTPFTQVALPHVGYTLQKMRVDPLTKDARIIWLTSFPMPPQNDGGFRNGYTALAADGYMVPQLEMLGVEFLYSLPVIRPRARESVDDHHWNMEVSHEGQFELNFRTGQVGRELNRMLTKKICEVVPPQEEKVPMNLRSVLIRAADQIQP